MPVPLRIVPSPPGDSQRRTIGILVSSDCSRLSAALVTVRGEGLQLQAEVGDGLIVQVPKETTALWHQLVNPGLAVGRIANPSYGEPGPQGSRDEILAAIGGLRAQLADVEASAVNALLDQATVSPDQILALGVHDPGLWGCSATGRDGYLGLSDAARLAEATGMNVIDAFPARDLAAGGQGGPTSALAEWVLLGSPNCNRALIDLGRTTRLTYLGAAAGQRGPSRLLSFEVGPGMRLIDLLAQRLTNGEQSFDPGGRLAVQGQRLSPLLEHWLADPYFRRSIPRWHPRGVQPDRFLFDALQMAVQAGWSIRDLLCTATHFVAESIAQAVVRDLPDDASIGEIVVTGGAQQNGMLLRELGVLFPNIPVVRTADLGIDSEALGPACAAILAFFHIDQVPASLPEVTGAEVARVLGSLTPGSPQSWQRLLSTIHGTRPMVRPLRSAI
jgi:anhydro-N-acetylmuramic acid kinase